MQEPINIPGCVPVRGIDIADPNQDRKSESYKWAIHTAKRFSQASGIIVNSSIDLEPGAFNALKEQVQLGNPPVYPIGPLIQRTSANGGDGSECLRWLDKQPNGSVLLVSFGSGGKLSAEQLNDLAMGFELSGQRFLWVVRRPHEKAPDISFYSEQIGCINNAYDFLPKE